MMIIALLAFAFLVAVIAASAVIFITYRRA